MQGAKNWPAYPALSAPLTIMGVERRWFLLSAMLGLAMWNAINSLMTGARDICGALCRRLVCLARGSQHG